MRIAPADKKRERYGAFSASGSLPMLQSPYPHDQAGGLSPQSLNIKYLFEPVCWSYAYFPAIPDSSRMRTTAELATKSRGRKKTLMALHSMRLVVLAR